MILLLGAAWAASDCAHPLGLDADRLATCETVGVRVGVDGGAVLGRYDAAGTVSPDPGEGLIAGSARVSARLVGILQAGADLAMGSAFDRGTPSLWAASPTAWLRLEVPDTTGGATMPAALRVALTTPASRYEWTWLGATGELGLRFGSVALGADGGVDVPVTGETDSMFRPGLRWTGAGEVAFAAGAAAQLGLEGGARGSLPGTAYGQVAGVAAYAPWIGAEGLVAPVPGWRFGAEVAIDPPIARWGWNRDAWFRVGATATRAW